MRLRSDLILLLVAFIWGAAFAVQRAVADSVGVFWFTGARFLLGALALLPLARRSGPVRRSSLGWMLLAGVILFAGANLQQLGLRYTTAGNAGFITGLYVVFVPFILVVFLGHRLHVSVWLDGYFLYSFNLLDYGERPDGYGLANCFFLNAASFLAVLLALALMKLPPYEPAAWIPFRQAWGELAGNPQYREEIIASRLEVSQAAIFLRTRELRLRPRWKKRY